MRLHKKLAIIDVETTGLDPHTHELTEFAIIRLDREGKEELRWSTKIKPVHLETASPYALEITDFSDEKWANAPLLEDVGQQIMDSLQGCILVGHNVSFDEGFLSHHLTKAGCQGKVPYHKVDTVTLAFEHLVPQGLTSLSLVNIRRFLGWDTSKAHQAMGDVEDTYRLFRHLFLDKVQS